MVLHNIAMACKVGLRNILIFLGKATYHLYNLWRNDIKVMLFCHSYQMGGAERVCADILEVVKDMHPILFICNKSDDHFFMDGSTFYEEHVSKKGLEDPDQWEFVDWRKDNYDFTVISKAEFKTFQELLQNIRMHA